jgi:hypothetical protein
MAHLNEDEQLKLKQILESDLFKKATDIVLEKTDGPVYTLLAPEQAMAMAMEKGARNAFRQLKILTLPRVESQTLSTKSLTRIR